MTNEGFSTIPTLESTDSLWYVIKSSRALPYNWTNQIAHSHNYTAYAHALTVAAKSSLEDV